VTGLYFAYGSNLSFERMRSRIESAQFVTRARLAGFRLALEKSGRDGSGKANVQRDEGAHVWGVVYRIDVVHWPQLDSFERGYARVETYVARDLTDDPVAYDWYKRLLVDGAREHGLPEDYVEALERLPHRPDPRRIT
jgi:gamma-glutamylcyclotransferase